MLNGISALLAIIGFYFAVLRLLRTCVKSPLEQNIHFYLFLSFLAWALSSGLRSIILVWGFTTNASLFFDYSLNGLVGAVLLWIGWPAIKEFKKEACLFNFGKFEAKEQFILVYIFFVLILYLYRVTIPWSDQDEAVCYGYISKLIAGGKTFSDLIRENAFIGFVRSQLVQSWDAQLYGLVNDTYLVRFDRLINFLFCGMGLFSFLRMMRVGRFWALTGLAVFFSTPELSYLALSMKVDAVVMMFELGALLSLILSVILFWQEPKSPQIFKASFILSSAALLLSAFAFGSRFSGIIPMLLSFGFCFYFLTKYTKRPFFSFGVSFALFILFMFFASPGYWMSYLIFNNPIYPTQPFWPFQGGAYTITMDHWKQWNIVGLPPGILQVYLIFALGTGVELLDKVFPVLNFLPMAAVKTTSMGWPYPVVLGFFCWPFFWRLNKTLNLIVCVFLFQLVCWSMGLHFSRLFVASSTLMILAAMMMADLPVPSNKGFQRGVQKILRVWIVLGLGLSLILQVWWFSKRYYGPFLISPQCRYQAEVGFLRGKDNEEQNILTHGEVSMLNRFFLNKEDHPVVYTVSNSMALQILFDEHIHVKYFDDRHPFLGGGNYLLINPAALAKRSLDKRTLLGYFPKLILTTPDTKWEVYTVAGSR